jgi:hypothetical protein
MKTMLLAAAALLSLGAGLAHAGEANGEPFGHAARVQYVANPLVRSDTGSQAYPDFASQPAVQFAQGGVVMPNGQNQIVQSLNSLPVGAQQGNAATMIATR